MAEKHAHTVICFVAIALRFITVFPLFLSTDREKRGQMLQVRVTVGRQKILHNRMVIQ